LVYILDFYTILSNTYLLGILPKNSKFQSTIFVIYVGDLSLYHFSAVCRGSSAFAQGG
jgi:hypothetical protein